MLRFLTHAWSRFAHLWAALVLPTAFRRGVWSAIGKMLGANLDEAGADLRQYRNFQAFFTRTLKPGIHRIDVGSEWVSPADSCWLSHVRVDGDVFVPAKKNRHRLSELLGGLGPSAATPWKDGMVSTFYLRPKDYHRVHSPCDMRVEAIRHIPGLLLPVNDFGQRVPGLFARNERVVIKGTSGGRSVFVIFVGAFMVGSIKLSHPGLSDIAAGGAVDVQKGAELGMFEFGSTVIVAADFWSEALLPTPAEVRMGVAVHAAP